MERLVGLELRPKFMKEDYHVCYESQVYLLLSRYLTLGEVPHTLTFFPQIDITETCLYHAVCVLTFLFLMYE